MRITKDGLGGLLFAGIGLMALLISWSYPAGSTLSMGPGYFPRAVSALMLIFGLMLYVRSLRESEPEAAMEIAWRPLGIITAAIVGFACLIQFGTIVAVAFLVVTAWFADPRRKRKTVPALLLAGIIIPILIFNYGLNLPIKIWGF